MKLEYSVLEISVLDTSYANHFVRQVNASNSAT